MNTNRLVFLTAACFHLCSLLVIAAPLQAQVPDRAAYRSPYSVEFSLDAKDLAGDLDQGRRADPKEQSSVDYREWYDTR